MDTSAHELLSAHTREGRYGGSFENRTRFLREVVAGVVPLLPGLESGCAFRHLTSCPSGPIRNNRTMENPAREFRKPVRDLLPYRWGFGVDPLIR